MLQITMTKDSQTKKRGTKTSFITNETETKVIDAKQYKNIVDAKSFFKNLGGSETHTKSYTCNGYCVTKIISTSPDKQMRSIYNFDFKWIENN
jgi:hypothetical protein